MTRAVAVLCAFALLVAPASAATAFTDVEDEVMCVSCNVPLNVAESPQADAQRAAIRRLIDRGLSKEEIKDALVAEYGDRVLALPKDDGFGIAVYLVPIAVAVAVIALLVTLLPKWRARGAHDEDPVVPAISAAEERRLQAELEQFDP